MLRNTWHVVKSPEAPLSLCFAEMKLDETERKNRDGGIKEISNVIHGEIKRVRPDYILLHHGK